MFRLFSRTLGAGLFAITIQAAPENQPGQLPRPELNHLILPKSPGQQTQELRDENAALKAKLAKAEKEIARLRAELTNAETSRVPIDKLNEEKHRAQIKIDRITTGKNREIEALKAEILRLSKAESKFFTTTRD